MSTTKSKRGPGRPRKSEIEAAKKPGKVGRPPGTAARIAEFKARLLITDGEKIFSKIVQKALNDNDPDQAAMLKMCFDRMLPVSEFKEKTDNSKPLVEVKITNADPSAGIHAQQMLDRRVAEASSETLEIDDAVTVRVNSSSE